MASECWVGAPSYEQYVGRWSRLVAREFLGWLRRPQALAWLDVGCGTGALSETILTDYAPASLVSLDRSFPYAAAARGSVGTGLARFLVADACDLPIRPGRFDRAVSGLVLNFVASPARMIAGMRAAVREGGQVAVYVWDYAGRTELMRHFWEAAAELDPAAGELDEGLRFPICAPEPLHELFEACGLAEVVVRPLDVPTVFRDFDDYWRPFLGGQGPAPGYVASLGEGARARLRDALSQRLPRAPDGTIPLRARAWAVRGLVGAGG